MYIDRESAVNIKFLKSENINYVLNAAEGRKPGCVDTSEVINFFSRDGEFIFPATKVFFSFITLPVKTKGGGYECISLKGTVHRQGGNNLWETFPFSKNHVFISFNTISSQKCCFCRNFTNLTILTILAWRCSMFLKQTLLNILAQLLISSKILF